MRSTKSCKLFILVLLVLLLTCISTAVPAQTFQVLYTFHGNDGYFPAGQLTLDRAGNIYGTTALGGSGSCGQPSYGCGTVFALDKNGVLLRSYSFNGEDGAGPEGGLS